MSVLIRGMEMPESCYNCVARYGGFCSVKPPESDGVCPPKCERPDWCPLVELPSKHGRLIDADEMKELWKGCTFDGDITCLLDPRPTVLEAEGEDNA